MEQGMKIAVTRNLWSGSPYFILLIRKENILNFWKVSIWTEAEMT